MQQCLLFQGKLTGTTGMWQQISSQQKFGRPGLSSLCLTGLNSPLLVVLASRSAKRFKAAWREGRITQQCQMKNLALCWERTQNSLDWKDNMKTRAAPTERLGPSSGRTERLQLHFQGSLCDCSQLCFHVKCVISYQQGLGPQSLSAHGHQ